MFKLFTFKNSRSPFILSKTFLSYKISGSNIFQMKIFKEKVSVLRFYSSSGVITMEKFYLIKLEAPFSKVFLNLFWKRMIKVKLKAFALKKQTPFLFAVII